MTDNQIHYLLLTYFLKSLKSVTWEIKSFHSEVNHWSRAAALWQHLQSHSHCHLKFHNKGSQHTHLLPSPHKRTCWEFHKLDNNSYKEQHSAFSQQIVNNRIHTLGMLWHILTTKTYKSLWFSVDTCWNTIWPKQTGQMSIHMLIFLTTFLNKWDLYDQRFISLPLQLLLVHLFDNFKQI